MFCLVVMFVNGIKIFQKKKIKILLRIIINYGLQVHEYWIYCFITQLREEVKVQ